MLGEPMVAHFVKDAILGFVGFIVGWFAKHINDIKK